MKGEAVLLVGGERFEGWKRVTVHRSIERVAGGFVLEVTHRWPGVDVPIGLREGLACEVLLDGETVISGYLDVYEPELTDHTSFIRVEGRDRTGDLVDCSAVHKGGQWRGVKLEKIVRDIAAPFGIAVEVQEDLDQGDTFASFSLEEGEKAFDAIDRACRLRAVLCTSTPKGDLLLTEASEDEAGAALIEGENVKRIRATHTWAERFSEITVKAQAPGSDHDYGEAVAHLKGQAKDAQINRYRPLVVMADQHTSAKMLAERAQWEVNVRMGRGKRGTCTVTGWRTGPDGESGPLWMPNTVARVRSERMNLDRDMLIVGCEYNLTEDGVNTEITFALPEAFKLVEGIGRSRLKKRLNDKTQKEKKKKGDGYSAPWDLDAPKVYRP